MKGKRRNGQLGQTAAEMMLFISVIVIAVVAVGYFVTPAYIDGVTKFNSNNEESINNGNTAGLPER